MRASHDKSGYVAVETFEHLLTGLTCSSPSQDDVSNLTFAFDTAQSFNDAQTAWSNHGDLLFVTHHATCNEAETRAVYKYVSLYMSLGFADHLRSAGHQPYPMISPTLPLPSLLVVLSLMAHLQRAQVCIYKVALSTRSSVEN